MHAHTLTKRRRIPYTLFASNNPHIMPPRDGTGGTFRTNDVERSRLRARFNWLAINVFVYFHNDSCRFLDGHACAAGAIVMLCLLCNANGAQTLHRSLAGFAEKCTCVASRPCSSGCICVNVFRVSVYLCCFNYIPVFLRSDVGEKWGVVPILTMHTRARKRFVYISFRTAHVYMSIASGIDTHDMD